MVSVGNGLMLCEVVGDGSTPPETLFFCVGDESLVALWIIGKHIRGGMGAALNCAFAGGDCARLRTDLSWVESLRFGKEPGRVHNPLGRCCDRQESTVCCLRQDEEKRAKFVVSGYFVGGKHRERGLVVEACGKCSSHCCSPREHGSQPLCAPCKTEAASASGSATAEKKA